MRGKGKVWLSLLALLGGGVTLSHATVIYTIPQDYEKIKEFTEGVLGNKTSNVSLDTAKKAGENVRGTVEGLTGQSIQGDTTKVKQASENVRKFLEGVSGSSDISNISNPDTIGQNVRNTIEGLTGENIDTAITKDQVSEIRKRIDQTFYDMYINPNSCFPQFIVSNPFKSKYNLPVIVSSDNIFDLNFKHHRGEFWGMGDNRMRMAGPRELMVEAPVRWKCSFSNKQQIQQIVQRAIQAQLQKTLFGLVPTTGGGNGVNGEQTVNPSEQLPSPHTTTVNGVEVTSSEMAQSNQQTDKLWENLLQNGGYQGYLMGAYLSITQNVEASIKPSQNPTGFCSGVLQYKTDDVKYSSWVNSIVLTTNRQSSSLQNLENATRINMDITGSQTNNAFCIYSVSPSHKVVYKTLKDKYGRLIGVKDEFGYDITQHIPFHEKEIVFFLKNANGHNTKVVLDIVNNLYTKTDSLLVEGATPDKIALKFYDDNGKRISIGNYNGIVLVYSKYRFFKLEGTCNYSSSSTSSKYWEVLDHYINTAVQDLNKHYNPLIDLSKEEISVVKYAKSLFLIVDPQKIKTEGYFVLTFFAHPYPKLVKTGRYTNRSFWLDGTTVGLANEGIYGPLVTLPEKEQALYCFNNEMGKLIGLVEQRINPGQYVCLWPRKYYGIMDRIYHGWKAGDFIDTITYNGQTFNVEQGEYAPVLLFHYKKLFKFPQNIEQQVDNYIVSSIPKGSSATYGKVQNFFVILPKSYKEKIDEVYPKLVAEELSSVFPNKELKFDKKEVINCGNLLHIEINNVLSSPF